MPPHEVPDVQIPGGSVKVLLGSLKDGDTVRESPIEAHHDMNYFVVTMEAGAVWRYSAPQAHDVAWAFGFERAAVLQREPSKGELLVFGNSGAIEIEAAGGPARVLLGTAERYTHPLVLGPSSVHSNTHSLAKGAERIQAARRAYFE